MPDLNQYNVTCYRCIGPDESPCQWSGPERKVYPRVLDIERPSCPDDAPMPDEFKDSYKGDTHAST